jgi:hypothetical protein
LLLAALVISACLFLFLYHYGHYHHGHYRPPHDRYHQRPHGYPQEDFVGAISSLKEEIAGLRDELRTTKLTLNELKKMVLLNQMSPEMAQCDQIHGTAEELNNDGNGDHNEQHQEWWSFRSNDHHQSRRDERKQQEEYRKKRKNQRKWHHKQQKRKDKKKKREQNKFHQYFS